MPGAACQFKDLPNPISLPSSMSGEAGAASLPVPRGYRRREPEKTTLHAVVREHLETLLDEGRLRSDAGTGYPRFIEHKFRRYLDCGLLARGFARLRCPSCGLERLCRYGLRAPFSLVRLSIDPDEGVRYRLHRPWPTPDGKPAILLEPVAFLRRLAALAPAPYVNLVRYHGVFANRSRFTTLLPTPQSRCPLQPHIIENAPQGDSIAQVRQPDVPPCLPRPRRLAWAQSSCAASSTSTPSPAHDAPHPCSSSRACPTLPSSCVSSNT